MENPFYKIKNGIITFLRSGFVEFENGTAVKFTPDPPKDILKDTSYCPACKNTGKVYVNYGQCADPTCDAHRGFEDCEVCNVRALRK